MVWPGILNSVAPLTGSLLLNLLLVMVMFQVLRPEQRGEVTFSPEPDDGGDARAHRG